MNEQQKKSSKNSLIIRFFAWLISIITRNPRRRFLIPILIPDVAAFFCEIMNYCHYLMRRITSYKLVSLCIESTNYCNLSCIECAVNRGLKRKKGYLDIDLLSNILDSAPSVKSVGISLWGEPLVHPKWLEIVKNIKKRGLSCSLYTNATLLTEHVSRALIEADIDHICISLDGIGTVYEHVRGYPYHKVENNILRFLELKKELKSPVCVEINMVLLDETKNHKEELIKAWKNKVDILNFQPDFRNQKGPYRSKPCSRLWHAFVVYYDGQAVPCCLDGETYLPLGNAVDMTIDEIFNGKNMKKLRKAHLEGKLPNLCKKCSDPYYDF